MVSMRAYGRTLALKSGVRARLKLKMIIFFGKITAIRRNYLYGDKNETPYIGIVKRTLPEFF